MRPCAQPHDGNVTGIPAKLGNVLLHPAEQGLLVPEAEVEDALAGGESRGQEAEGADAVVEVDADDVVLGEAHEAGHVALGAQAAVEGAAVDVDGDGQRPLPLPAAFPGGPGRPVQVQVEAIPPTVWPEKAPYW